MRACFCMYACTHDAYTVLVRAHVMYFMCVRMYICVCACACMCVVRACVRVCVGVRVRVFFVLNITCVRLSAEEVLCTGNFLAKHPPKPSYFPLISSPAKIRCVIQL